MPNIIQQHPPTSVEPVTAAAHTLSGKQKELFNKLKDQFIEQFRTTFPDKLAAKTVVVIPSLTLDHTILSKVK